MWTKRIDVWVSGSRPHSIADTAMSVAENIGYGLKIRGVSKEQRAARVAELVALTNIAGLENRRIDQLSGGQRQRVALARAVAIRPGILLLDEPLTALDAALRERLRSELNRLLRALGITAIYVTHDQSEAMELGDRVVVMSKGRIAQIGSPREIYFEPCNRFVAEFIGAANIIESPVENGQLVLPGGRQPVAGPINQKAALAMCPTREQRRRRPILPPAKFRSAFRDWARSRPWCAAVSFG